jgi:hypothetical protein
MSPLHSSHISPQTYTEPSLTIDTYSTMCRYNMHSPMSHYRHTSPWFNIDWLSPILPYVTHCLINETDFINFSSQAKGRTQTRKVIVVSVQWFVVFFNYIYLSVTITFHGVELYSLYSMAMFKMILQNHFRQKVEMCLYRILDIVCDGVV